MTEEQIIKKACDYLADLDKSNPYLRGNEAYHAYNAYIAGAKWADAHNPEIAYLEHEIERLKSKLQAADDLNTLLTAELEKAKSPWISVEERLPEESRKHKGSLSDAVFVVTNEGDGTSARYDHATKTWCPAKILRGHITHWMPIPELTTE